MWIQTEKKRIAMPYKYSYDYEEKPYTPPKLQTNRSMWKLILLNIVTLGIYSIFFFIPFSMDPDRIAPKRDHTKTTNYLPAYIVSLFTFHFPDARESAFLPKGRSPFNSIKNISGITKAPS